MTTTVLVRHAEEVEFAELEATVFDQARQALGYVPDVPIRRPLLKSLQSLGVVPFNEASVARYKRAKELQSGRPFAVAWGLVALAVIALGLYFKDWGGAAFALIPALPSFSYAVFGRGQWQDVSFSNFKEPIPTFALHTALALKRIAISSSITVERHVIRREHNADPLGDPFLVATLDSERYYIEVWDEPSFTEQRGV